MVAAWGRGIAGAPYPARALLGLCCGTHGGDTRVKRACSQHIYILCNIYIEGYTGFVHKSSAVPAPVLSGRCGPGGGADGGSAGGVLWSSLLSFCAPRLGSRGGVDWERDEHKPKDVPVSPTPGEPTSPEHRPRTTLALPNHTKALAKAGGKGAWTRFGWFVPKPPAPSPAGLALCRKASFNPRLAQGARSRPRLLLGLSGAPPPPLGRPTAGHDRLGWQQHPRGMCATSSLLRGGGG